MHSIPCTPACGHMLSMSTSLTAQVTLLCSNVQASSRGKWWRSYAWMGALWHAGSSALEIKVCDAFAPSVNTEICLSCGVLEPFVCLRRIISTPQPRTVKCIAVFDLHRMQSTAPPAFIFPSSPITTTSQDKVSRPSDWPGSWRMG